MVVGSFYDPELEEGCAFEELISFHGGLGGPQTRPFVLYPADLPEPDGPLIGAESVHRVLAGWRTHLQQASGSDAVVRRALRPPGAQAGASQAGASESGAQTGSRNAVESP